MLHCWLAVRPRVARRGISAAYSISVLIALCGFVSLAVDLGRVQLAKTELRTATDAAARAAAGGLTTSPAQARASAIAIAAANTCDGVAVGLIDPDDIELGFWDPDTRTFYPATGWLESFATAVRITAHRSASRGNGIPLVFAKLLGRNTCDIHAVAIANATFQPAQGFVSLNAITTHDRPYFVSYRSWSTTTPTIASANSNSIVKANGAITYGANGHIWGDVKQGPSGSVEFGMQVTGTQTTLGSNITAPADPPWSPGINPGGIPQAYTVNSDTTLSGGTYMFTSLKP